MLRKWHVCRRGNWRADNQFQVRNELGYSEFRSGSPVRSWIWKRQVRCSRLRGTDSFFNEWRGLGETKFWNDSRSLRREVRRWQIYRMWLLAHDHQFRGWSGL